MSPSLLDLGAAWREHASGKKRAVGGINALRGFSFQLALSLHRFLDAVDKGTGAELAFEGISDLAELTDGVVYLTQVKATLTTSKAKDAAHEALAVDDFLAEEFSAIRTNVRFEIRCARHESGDPRTFTAADLGLKGSDARRWRSVRARFGKPRVATDPYTSLLVRLFATVSDPFQVASALLGDLVRLLGADEPQRVVTETLLERLTDARQAMTATPPPRLVTAEDFVARHEGSSILLGQRPTIDFLARGFFMPRPERATAAADAIVRSLGRDTGDERVRICWLSGTSGAGKSVLLLQALEVLAARQAALALHVVPPTTASLEASLSYWSGTSGEVVIAIDDLYAPGRRDGAQWDRVVALATATSRESRLVIATNGPDDYLNAFSQLAGRTGAFVVDEAPVLNLSPLEQADFTAWYRERSGSPDASTTDEQVFVVAAFLAAVGGDAGDQVSEFAMRFRDRAAALGLEDAVLSALAVNRLGIAAPAALFGDALDDLERLVEEEVVQREQEGDMALVTMFHQRLADPLYASLVPLRERHRRAAHLVDAITAADGDDGYAASVVGTLHQVARRSAADRELLSTVVEATWEPIWCDAPAQRLLSARVAWVFAARATGFDFDRAPFMDRLLGWATDVENRGYVVSRACRVLLTACPAREVEIRERVLAWLQDRQEDPDWPFVCRLALRHGDARELASQWLTEHAGRRGAAELFVEMARSEDFAREDIARIVEAAPTSAFVERTLWMLAEQFGFDASSMLQLVVRRGAAAPTRAVTRAAAQYVVAHARDDDGGDYDVVLSSLLQSADRPSFTRFLRVIAVLARPRSAVADAIADAALPWLRVSLDEPEWPSTWQAAYQRRYEDTWEEMEALGRAWLVRHPDARAWRGVMQTLLLRSTREGGWDEPEYIWGVALDAGSGEERASVRAAAIRWLSDNRTDAFWVTLFDALFAHSPTDELHDLGREWLGSFADAPDWQRVEAVIAAKETRASPDP